MFEVLTFVYEHYFTGASCPEPELLERKLSAVGFESDEIREALHWLQGLRSAAPGTAATPWLREPAQQSLRIYSLAEQRHMGARCLGFMYFLASSGALNAAMREVVVDRVMAAPGGPVALGDLKLIVLMVFWSFGVEPDALVLDELCDNPAERTPH